MVRLLIAATLIMVVATPAGGVETRGGYTLLLGADVGYVDVSGHTSWVDGSVGKLRYSDSSFEVSRAFADLRARITDTVSARLALEAYSDDLGDAIDLAQAYIEWRPVPKSPTRTRLRAGAFYPLISLENVDPGWSSPYTLSSSAINTWVAEELRSLGLELSISRRPQSLGGAHEFGLTASIFGGSDPAGALLAWKGWSIHDRQTRYSDKLPLPPLPQIQPGMMFQTQAPYVTPLPEIDNRAGYSLAADWDLRRRLHLRAGVFNNRADPAILVSGQYGWYTEFVHSGLQARLPGDLGLIGQYMRGSTVMGPVVNGARVVDVEFDAWFLLLTRSFGKHRMTVRFDDFEVWENDDIPEDDNSEAGRAWTLSYRWNISDAIGLAAEWLSIRSDHLAWTYYGLEQSRTERQIQLSALLRF